MFWWTRGLSLTIGKGRITFWRYWALARFPGIFQSLRTPLFNLFLFELSLGHHPKGVVKYMPSFKVQPLSGRGWKSMSAPKLRRKCIVLQSLVAHEEWNGFPWFFSEAAGEKNRGTVVDFSARIKKNLESFLYAELGPGLKHFSYLISVGLSKQTLLQCGLSHLK